VIYVLRLNDDDPEQDMLEGEEDLPACTQYVLPSSEFQVLWESLILEDGIKDHLLGYSSSSMLFSSAGVDKNKVWP